MFGPGAPVIQKAKQSKTDTNTSIVLVQQTEIIQYNTAIYFEVDDNTQCMI